MDLEKIKLHNEEQQKIAEENAKTTDLAIALKYILDSNKSIEGSVRTSILALIKFLKDHKAEVSVNNQVIPQFTEIVDAISDLKEEVKASKSHLETVATKEVDFSEMVSCLNRVEKALSKLPTENPTIPDKVTVDNQVDYTLKFDELTDSVKNIKVEAPVVNVEKPDLDPVKQAIESAAPTKTLPPKLNLQTYRAQDLDEMEEGIQYVGFTNPDGYWYILKNNQQKNTMRYKFGKDNYYDAWAIAPTFRYKLLEEAIRAIKA